jgi:hypothetical protein
MIGGRPLKRLRAPLVSGVPVLGHIDLKDPQVDGVLVPQIAHVDHLVLGHRSLLPTHKGHWG